MNLYIADTHFGHQNAIAFDRRPFADVREMDEVMIRLWNGRVQPEDDVWVLGDFCFRNEQSPVYYLRQLRGKKHLIVGNHDGKLLQDKQAMSFFETVDQIRQVTDGEYRIVLCHFPLAEWTRSRHGTLHVYGHIHTTKDETYAYMAGRYPDQAFNAGCMINNYTPVSLQELRENNKRFLGCP